MIMKNPSRANERISDQTINTILEIFHRFGYAKVYVTNLIPVYSTDQTDISDKEDLSLYAENDRIISELAESVSRIFVGWGENNGIDYDFYSERITAIKKLLKGKTAYCYTKNRSGNPKHPSRRQWKYDKQESDYAIIEF